MKKKFMKKIMTMALAFSLSTAVVVPSTSVLASPGAELSTNENYESSHNSNYNLSGLSVHSYLQRSGDNVTCEVHFSGVMDLDAIGHFYGASATVQYSVDGGENWGNLKTISLPLTLTNKYTVEKFKCTTKIKKNLKNAVIRVWYNF